MLQIETKPALLGINYNLPQVILEFQRSVAQAKFLTLR